MRKLLICLNLKFLCQDKNRNKKMAMLKTLFAVLQLMSRHDKSYQNVKTSLAETSRLLVQNRCVLLCSK